MSGGAPKEVFALLTPKFEQQTGNKVKFTYAVISALREKLAAGEKADVLVMPTQHARRVRQGRQGARARPRHPSALVGISVVVQEGAPKPDLSTKEKFKQAMLAAASVTHATPGATPSGTHMGKVIGTARHCRRDERQSHSNAGARRRRAVGGERGGRDRLLSDERGASTPRASPSSGRCRRASSSTTIYGGAVTADSAAPDAAAAFVNSWPIRRKSRSLDACRLRSARAVNPAIAISRCRSGSTR